MRTFVAIDVAEEVRAALAREQTRLKELCPPNARVSWTRPQGLHLTLRFLGEITPERVPQVVAALRGVSRFESFTVEAKDLGFFPNAIRPRVFWAGLMAPDALRELARKVHAALATLWFEPGEEPFHPHLTLARFRSQRPDRELMAAIGNASSASFGRFAVSEFFLFESRLRPAGAEYHKLARFPSSPSELSPASG